MIEIEKEHGKIVDVLARIHGDGVIEAVHEQQTIGEAGHCVVESVVRHLAFGVLAFCDLALQSAALILLQFLAALRVRGEMGMCALESLVRAGASCKCGGVWRRRSNA